MKFEDLSRSVKPGGSLGLLFYGTHYIRHFLFLAQNSTSALCYFESIPTYYIQTPSASFILRKLCKACEHSDSGWYNGNA